ncbi:MAG: elongation factor 1-alpha, partial [Candidatus Nanoarchaeia archaeon]|nr:elongation factor 1-alpha [Candidatus Nanoarchaeia archaeon]
CQFIELVKQINPANGETIKDHPDMLKNGDTAIVKLRPTKPMVIEKQSEIPHMSRFAIRDAGTTVAAGMCIDYVKKTA